MTTPTVTPATTFAVKGGEPTDAAVAALARLLLAVVDEDETNTPATEAAPAASDHNQAANGDLQNEN